MLKAKEINDFKKDLYQKQNGICCLCRLELDADVQKNHLDHDHALDGVNAGKVRGLLCCLCNVLEGKIKNQWKRSGLASRNIDMHEWLKNMIEYVSQDYSDSRIHPKYLPDSVARFKRMNKPEQLSELNNLGFTGDGTKAELVKQYRKLLRAELLK